MAGFGKCLVRSMPGILSLGRAKKNAFPIPPPSPAPSSTLKKNRLGFFRLEPKFDDENRSFVFLSNYQLVVRQVGNRHRTFVQSEKRSPLGVC